MELILSIHVDGTTLTPEELEDLKRDIQDDVECISEHVLQADWIKEINK